MVRKTTVWLLQMTKMIITTNLWILQMTKKTQQKEQQLYGYFK